MKGGQFRQTELANIDLSKQTKKREAVLIWVSVTVSPDLIIINNNKNYRVQTFFAKPKLHAPIVYIYMQAYT